MLLQHGRNRVRRLGIALFDRGVLVGLGTDGFRDRADAFRATASIVDTFQQVRPTATSHIMTVASHN